MLFLAEFDCKTHPLAWFSSLASDVFHHYGFVWWLLGGDWNLVNTFRPAKLTVGLCWWVHCPVSFAAALSSWHPIPWGTVHHRSSLTHSTCETDSKAAAQVQENKEGFTWHATQKTNYALYTKKHPKPFIFFCFERRWVIPVLCKQQSTSSDTRTLT